MKRPVIIIDNGHGVTTRGKCSPDGRHKEWEWTRRAARMLAGELAGRGFEVMLLVPEDADVSLGERVRRANAVASPAVLVSLHNNAAGDGSVWHGARGYCAFVSPRACEAACALAGKLCATARSRGFGGNRSVPPEGFWRGDFAICSQTRHAAVLSEVLFQDNRDDVAVLESEDGIGRLVAQHADVITQLWP